MKTSNPTPIGNHLRVVLKNSALALAVALIASADTARATNIYNFAPGMAGVTGYYPSPGNTQYNAGAEGFTPRVSGSWSGFLDPYGDGNLYFGPTTRFTLKADPGNAVTLLNFNFGQWDPANVSDFTVLDHNDNVLATVTGVRAGSMAGFAWPPLTDTQLTIVFGTTQQDYSWINNIKFSQQSTILRVNLDTPADTQGYPTGSSVTATATVEDPGAFTDTVTFHTTPISPSGPTVVTVSTNTSSPFSAVLGALAAGTYEIYATVANNAIPAGTATSATRTFTVAAAIPTTTGLDTSATPSAYGQNVTFTATVLPIPTSGTVQFFDGADPLGSPVAVNTGTGEATYSSTRLGAGTHNISANYSGHWLHVASTTAAAVSQVVDKAPLTVKALTAFRAPNTANPDPLTYEITGYQNGENLATSGVTGTPALTTDAVLSSPVGNYVITCAPGSLAASNYSFTLENGTLTITDLACQLGILNLNANGGINPATGVAWALGDTYRLIFVTSGTTACTSTDIATYNAFVQGLAAASTSYPKLGSVTWKVVGSTATVNARDNTNTNPSVDGAGVPIVRMDGLFVIANNNTDLWNGINSTHVPGQPYLAVSLDENGVQRLDERVRTGSALNGTAGNVLGGSPQVQTGRNFNPNHYDGYGDKDWIADYNATAADAGPVYAMSGILTIVSTTAAGYGTWANANNAVGQTPAQDHDNDGVENGIEYFMGQTGSSFTAMPGLDATNKVSWTMDAAYQGTYEVQTSTDLVTWTNVDPKPTPSGGTLSYTLPPGLGKQFVRLLVTPTP